ncbi:MAG TPA: DUF4157 domain-containing protein, partial [Kofleriaceae bacterium]
MPKPHAAAEPEVVPPHGGHWDFARVTAEPPTDPQERDAELQARTALRRSGEPMVGGEWRPYFEQRFGADFSEVRIHADAAAARISRALGANAFTVGRDVHFAADRFAPGTPAGRALLAHELGHVLQQRATGPLRVQCEAGAEPTTVAEVDEAIARLEAESQKQGPGTATSEALFKRRNALLAKRAALLGKTSTPPPAKASPPPPDWRDAIAAFNAQHPAGDFPTFGKPAAKPAAPTNTVGMIVESHVAMATSARKTHWASASELVAFMDAYIAYAAAHPAFKLEHDQAVAARESVLADYLAAHGATPFPFDPAKLVAAGQLLPKKTPTAPKPPSKSTGMIVESHVSMAKSVRSSHFASEEAMVAFMDEYIAYAKEHSTTQKEYQEAVAAKDGLIAEYHANIVASQLAQIEAELGKQHEADTVKMLQAPLTQGQQLTLTAAGTAELLGTAALEIVDELIKFVPIVGEAVMAIEAISGRKWLGLGAEISDDERISDGVFAIIGLLPIVGQVMRLGAKTAAAVVARTAVRVGEEAPRLLRRLALIHALQTEEPALRRLAAMLKAHKPLQEAEIAVLRRVETKLGGGGTGTWMTAGSAAQKAAPKTGVLGLPIAEGVTVKLPAAVAKETEQVAAKKVLDAGVAKAGGTTKIFDMGVGDRGLLVEGLANDVYKTMGGNVQRTPTGYDFIDHYYGGTTSKNGGVTVVEGPTVISD